MQLAADVVPAGPAAAATAGCLHQAVMQRMSLYDSVIG
jgi:hypothetical protein